MTGSLTGMTLTKQKSKEDQQRSQSRPGRIHVGRTKDNERFNRLVTATQFSRASRGFQELPRLSILMGIGVLRRNAKLGFVGVVGPLLWLARARSQSMFMIVERNLA
jgi:hypothetical protein